MKRKAQLRQGDIVCLSIPFTGRKDSKEEKLALIVSSDRYNELNEDAIIVPLASVSKRGIGELDHVLTTKEAEFAGLRKPLVVRTGVILTVRRELLEKRGKLPSRTVKEIVLKIIKNVFSPDKRIA